MATECTQRTFAFQPLGRREVRARFDGGKITSDAGGLLLRETERATGIIRQLAGCFTDHRDPDLIEHTVYELLAQRIYALCLGYEDLNDHDQLRHDPLLAILVGKNDPLCAKLRPSHIDASAGALTELKRIVAVIRAKWPGVSILIRGDSGFCRESIMAWCEEEEGVDYLLGIVRTKRLLAAIGEELAQAKVQFAGTGQPARLFKDFT